MLDKDSGPPGRGPAKLSNDDDVIVAQPHNGQPRLRIGSLCLDWAKAGRYRSAPGPCRRCGGSTNLVDDNGLYCHKVCAEAELEAGVRDGAAS
jgi:hypothetical protein